VAAATTIPSVSAAIATSPVLDVGQRQVVRAAVPGEPLLGELTGGADEEEQDDAGRRLYHGTPAITPSLTSAAASAAIRTAHQSRDICQYPKLEA